MGRKKRGARRGRKNIVAGKFANIESFCDARHACRENVHFVEVGMRVFLTLLPSVPAWGIANI